MRSSRAAATAGVWLALGWAQAAHAAISVGGDVRVDPADFSISVFATGLPYPTSLQELDDGSLLVLTNVPSAGLFASTGELVRLVDADRDGVADGPPSVLYTGLPGVATSVRRLGTLVFVSSREFDNEKITVLRAGASPGDPLGFLGSIDFSYPTPAVIQNHRNVALAVRPSTQPGAAVDLVFNIGSELNSVETVTTVSGGGLLAGLPGAASLAMDALHLVRVSDVGGSVSLSNLVQLADGLRNAAGIAFHPTTGDLWFADNGIDPSGVPQSADELNRIEAASVGTGLFDFGFATDFIEYRTGSVATGLSVQPLVAFQPIPDPQTGDKSEGAVEIAFAPPGFPAGLRNGLLIGFHGEFSQTGAANSENPVVFVDLEGLDYFHFVATGEPALGHPNGLLATANSLFIADLASGGSVFSNGSSGAIHQIRSIAPAPVPVLGGGPLLGLALGALLLAIALGRAFPTWLHAARQPLARTDHGA